MNKSLALILRRNATQDKIDPSELKKILIVRINYRIGNSLFMTPLIHALADTIPDASIDLLVGNSNAKNMLQPMPQVTTVYTAPRKLLRSPIAIFRRVRALNENRYDAIFLPALGSTSSNAAVLLIKARYKVGFFSPDSWSPVDHAVPVSDKIRHEALKPLQLMQVLTGAKTIDRPQLDIEMSAKEQQRGRKLLSRTFQKHSVPSDSNAVVGVFRGARLQKKIPTKWWRSFVKRLRRENKDLLVIDILEPGVDQPLSEADASISMSDLRELGTVLANLNGFVSADTGIMHLATAANVPVLALFNTTDSSRYGPLGDRHTVIHVDGDEVRSVVDAATKVFSLPGPVRASA